MSGATLTVTATRNAASWESYVHGLDWCHGVTKNEQTYYAALRAASLGIDPVLAHEGIAHQIKGSGGDYDEGKVDRQIERAFEFVSRESGIEPRPSRPKYVFQLETLRRVAAKADHVDESCLAARSPVDPRAITPWRFLRALYRLGERVILFDTFLSQGQEVWHNRADGEDLSDVDRFAVGQADGVWFLAQPVDGLWHSNPREGGKSSRRSEESVTSWRYLVLECDHEKEHPGVNALWLAALVQMPIPIVAIYTSGGRSIHALVLADAGSKEEWDAIKWRIVPIVVPLGADQGALTAVRLSRLPGCERGGKLQRLLFLNPAADGTPIVRIPARKGAGEVQQ